MLSQKESVCNQLGSPYDWFCDEHCPLCGEMLDVIHIYDDGDRCLGCSNCLHSLRESSLF